MIADQVAHPPPDAAPALTRAVAVTDRAYDPTALVVAPGTAIAWTNVGRNRHTVTEDSARFESGTLAPGATFRLSAPDAPGTYAYHCRFHGYIRGTLTVSTVSLATPVDVVVGRRPVLTGEVPGAAAGTVVRVERRVPGAWEEAGRAVTDAAGAFHLTGTPILGRTAFRAIAGDEVSPSVRGGRARC